MSSKIVLNGAGSAEFTKELLADILGFEELADVTIALHDVNAERLQTAEAIARWTADALGAPARIESHLDRRAALDGADHVISMIRVGGHEGLALDFRVPARHGIRQAMADTLGIGSIFRALCTIPSLLALGKDISELCPQAWLYNYTNPMAALVWSIYEGTAHRRVVGVCMSAQNTAEQLAELVGVPFDEVSWLTAGMNHQAWLCDSSTKDAISTRCSTRRSPAIPRGSDAASGSRSTGGSACSPRNPASTTRISFPGSSP